jgi:hypothetical protein
VNLSEKHWTVVATSRPGTHTREWSYRPGFTGKTINFAALCEAIILMHRRDGDDWQLVARHPCAHWRKVQAWRVRKPLEVLPPAFRKVRA